MSQLHSGLGSLFLLFVPFFQFIIKVEMCGGTHQISTMPYFLCPRIYEFTNLRSCCAYFAVSDPDLSENIVGSTDRAKK